jgi:hypothetical protein
MNGLIKLFWELQQQQQQQLFHGFRGYRGWATAKNLGEQPLRVRSRWLFPQEA